jgi:membrane protein DedA with SNARE-associated domain
VSLAGLIADYGYVALFVGTLLEGETLLILAGFAAHQGYLQLHWVITVALLGGFLGDQFYFWLGRWRAAWVLSRFKRFAPLFERTNALIDRYHEVLIVAIRFLYGLRTVGPMAFGMSKVPVWRFVFFNALGATIWAVVIGGAGFLFGQAMKLWLHDLKRVEEVLLFSILCGGLVFWAWRRWSFNRKFHR